MLVSFTGQKVTLHILNSTDSPINPFPATIFVLKMSAFTSAAYLVMHFKLDFFMEANMMNPDQTVPKEQSDLGPYCLQYQLPKNIGR